MSREDDVEPRENSPALGELSREIHSLRQTTRDMHEENRERGHQQDVQLDTIIKNQHGMELSIQRGDSALHERLAVHEATAHHAGTFDRLNNHQARLDGHDVEIGTIKQRFQFEGGRSDAKQEHHAASLAKYGFIGAIGAIGAVLAGVAQAAVTWFTSNGHRGP